MAHNQETNYHSGGDAHIPAPPPAAPPPPPPPSDSDLESVKSLGSYQDNYHTSSAMTPDSKVKSQASTPSPHNPFGSGKENHNHHRYNPHSYHSGDDDEDDRYHHSNVYSGGAYAAKEEASSYQKPSSRAAPMPSITNYGISPVVKSVKGTTVAGDITRIHPSMRGDPSLRPNTGHANDEYGGIGSLREVTTRLRYMTIASTIFSLIWEGFAFPTRLIYDIHTDPAKPVLGGYLAFFCLMLLGVELNIPRFRDNFGILYHPLGRGTLLLLMSVMCVGILALWWEILLGLIFLVCGVGYFYAYIKYPEYRRWQDYNEYHPDFEWWNTLQETMQRGGRDIITASWARPSASDLSQGWHQSQSESQSLLHNV